jgi:hypothetical protein
LGRSRTALLSLAVLAAACEEEPKGPPPPVGGTSSLTGTIVTASASASDGSSGMSGGGTGTGTEGTGGPAGCDPMADPSVECGPGQECSFVDRQCHSAMGTVGEGQPCEVTDELLLLDTCLPALLCGQVESGSPRCLAPCDENVTCGDGQSCIGTPPPVPGLCLEQCDALLASCAVVTDGCYPLLDLDGAFTAVCLPAGMGVVEDPCTYVNDCGAGFACTSATTHASQCGGQPACCAQLCNAFAGDCAGIDTLCADYEIPTSSDLGVCVAP